MRKVLVIGPGGTGKTTLATRIGEQTGLPVLHLDALYWKAGWKETPGDAWVQTVEVLIRQDAWIIDGNYGGTLDLRLAACDTVIYLDLPRFRCLWRVLKRRVHFHGKTRPDMAAECPERLTWAFLKWIWNYPHERRPSILQKLKTLSQKKNVHILDSRHNVEQFLARLPIRRQ
jgi:adenylate kinase family enzyme